MKNDHKKESIVVGDARDTELRKTLCGAACLGIIIDDELEQVREGTTVPMPGIKQLTNGHPAQSAPPNPECKT